MFPLLMPNIDDINELISFIYFDQRGLITKGWLIKLRINNGFFCHNFVNQHLSIESTLDLEGSITDPH